MRKSLNKLASIVVLLLVIILSACGKKEATETDENRLANLNDQGMPIVKEKIKLNFFAGQAPQTAPNWNDVLIFNEYEKMTNMDIEWEMVPHAGLTEKRNLRLSTGDLPDAFHSADVPILDIFRYGQQGVFIPLNDLIDEYAPNFKALLDEYPDMRKALTFPDGNIYSFPQMIAPDFYSSRIGPVPWVNQEWLDEFGMDVPETTDDFYEYLVAVKENDPGGNNAIPYGAPNMNVFVEFLFGSFGIANKGTVNPHIDLQPDDPGTLRFYPITDEYKEMLEYIHKLYSEGLIEQNIFTIETNTFLAQGSEGRYGSTNWYGVSQNFGEEAGSKFTNMPPLKGPRGDQVLVRINAPVNKIGAFLITSENQHPEATVRWVDHFYGDEGQILFFMGVEGETFEEKPDGRLDHVDKITNHPDGLTFDQAVAQYLTFLGGNYPSMITQEYYRGGANSEERLNAAADLVPYLVEDPWAAFIYTKEESDQLAGFGSDINKYVREMRDKFIAGDVPLSEWDNYVNEIKNMGLDDYMEIQQAAFERYENN